MRKFSTLILILIVIGLSAEAQPNYYNHATTTGGANVFPLGSLPATGKRVQWIVAPGEFGTPTPSPSGNITSLWLWSNSTGTTTYTTLTVRFANVSTSTFFTQGAFYTGAMTTSLAATTTLTFAVNSWVEIPLTTPFAYDNTMNLVVEIAQCGYTGPAMQVRQLPYGTSPNYRRQYSDASSPCGSIALATGGDQNIAGIGLSIASGCTFASSFGSGTINPSGALVTISTCSFAGEYSTISGAVNGQTLRFTSSVATDWITVHSGTFNGPVIAFGQTPLTFANTFTGTIFPHWSTNSSCGTQAACRTTTVQCTSCGIANDPCTGAININCSQTITGTTVGATIDAVATCVTTLNTAPGVWYSFAGDGFPTTLSLCGSSYDTKIGVFSGSCAGLVCVTGNDDFCGLQSQVTFTSAIGTNYYVLVTGFGTATGAFTLTRTCAGSCTITLTSAAGTNNQTKCVNQPITNITYATTGATGATFTGLPAGVTGVWASNVATISGTPTAAGVFNYTVTLTGPCPGTNATGTITVVANPQIGIIDDPTGPLCQGDPKLLTAVLGVPLVNYCFTQSSSPTPVAGSVACNAGGITTDNSYWRVYPLTPYGLPGPLTISSVKFGVELNANGPYNITARLYTQTGAAFPGGTRTLIRSQVISVPNMTLGVITAPITPVTVNPTDVIVIELFTPNIPGVSRFFIGSNPAAQTGVSYISAAPCGIPNPTDLAALGFPNMHILLDFCGSTGGGGTPIPAGWTYLWSPAAGLNSTTTNPVAASPAVTTTYTVVVTNLSGCSGTASILITVNTRPVVTVQPPASTVVCAGSTATITGGGSGTGVTYQWQVSTTGAGGPWVNLTNGPPYSGVTTATLTINPVTLAMNGYIYRLAVGGACPPTVNSNGSVLTVNPLPNVTVTPVVSCGSTTGNCTAITASGANTYTWSPVTGLFLDCAGTIPYTGTNAATVYARPLQFTTYTVTGTLTATGCSNTAVALVNYTPPAPTVTPSSVTMCLGDPAVKLKSVSSTNTSLQFCSGPLNIPVPDNTPNGVNNSIVVSGVPASCNISSMSVTWNMTHTWNGDMVFVLKAPNGNILNLDYYLTNTGGAGVTTGFVNTKVSSAGANALSTGTGTYTATFRADAFTAAGLFGPPGPTGFLPTGNTWTQLFSTPNGTYTLAMYDGGPADLGILTSWCLDITYTCGVPTTAATWSPAAGLFSDAAAGTPYIAGTAVDSVWTRPTPAGVYNYNVTVQSLATPPATIATPMAGGNQNSMIFFNVANNNAVTYNLTSVSTNSGGTGAVQARVWYKTSPIAGNPGAINAGNGWIVSPTFNINVIAGTLNLVSNTLSIPIPAGQTYGIGVEFLGAAIFIRYTNGTGVIQTYSNNGCSIITDGNVGWGGPVAPGPPANNPRNFNGSVSLSAGNLPPCTSPARVVTVTVNTQATVTVQPLAQTVCTDKVATFSVTATIPLGTIAYQWEVSTDGGNTYNNVSNGGVYSGATTNTLTITNPPVSMNGYYYRVRLQGPAPCAPAYSFFRLLTVNPLPTVVISASPYTRLFPGLITTLSSTVSPFAAATYTWYRDGIIVSGATGATLSRDVDGQGDYYLKVTDVNGCTNTSNTISLRDSVSGNCFLYPNPNKGLFQVRYHSVANNVLARSVTVYNGNGTRVLTQYFTVVAPYARMDLDLRPYGKGVFWVEIGDHNGNRITMCRAVVQ